MYDNNNNNYYYYILIYQNIGYILVPDESDVFDYSWDTPIVDEVPYEVRGLDSDLYTSHQPAPVNHDADITQAVALRLHLPQSSRLLVFR